MKCKPWGVQFLCKLLVILLLLRFSTKAASRTGSCYGDFWEEGAVCGCLSGSLQSSSVAENVARRALLSHPYKCGQYFIEYFCWVRLEGTTAFEVNQLSGTGLIQASLVLWTAPSNVSACWNGSSGLLSWDTE